MGKYIALAGAIAVGCSLLMGGYYFGLGQAAEFEETRLSLRGFNFSGDVHNIFLDSSLRLLLIGVSVALSHLLFLLRKKLIVAIVNLPLLLFSVLQSVFVLTDKTDPDVSVSSAWLSQIISLFWYVDFVIPIALVSLIVLYISFLLKTGDTNIGFKENNSWLRSY